VRMRVATPGEELLYRARPNLRIGRVDWPLFALFGGIATGISFVVIVVQNPATRWAGLGWLAAGLAFYVVYRRRSVREPLTRTVKAPPAYGPALALQYRRLLVPVLAGRASDEALDIAAGLSAERGAQITAVYVVEVPLDQALSAELPAEEALANRELDEARAIGESYGVTVIPRLVRARNAGAAIVREAERRASEIVVIGAPRKDLPGRKRAIFGTTVDYVLKNAGCRVLVTALREDAA
jgi:basic amino acid/polyamine antiporter, APA family